MFARYYHFYVFANQFVEQVQIWNDKIYNILYNTRTSTGNVKFQINKGLLIILCSLMLCCLSPMHDGLKRKQIF